MKKRCSNSESQQKNKLFHFRLQKKWPGNIDAINHLIKELEIFEKEKNTSLSLYWKLHE